MELQLIEHFPPTEQVLPQWKKLSTGMHPIQQMFALGEINPVGPSAFLTLKGLEFGMEPGLYCRSFMQH